MLRRVRPACVPEYFCGSPAFMSASLATISVPPRRALAGAVAGPPRAGADVAAEAAVIVVGFAAAAAVEAAVLAGAAVVAVGCAAAGAAVGALGAVCGPHAASAARPASPAPVSVTRRRSRRRVKCGGRSLVEKSGTSALIVGNAPLDY